MNFENFKMKESKLADQFMTQVMNIVKQLWMNGEELLDKKMGEKVLQTLPKKFDAVVVAIEESSRWDVGIFSIPWIQNK